MPFKKGNSKYFKIRRKSLPGYGDSGTLSTRTTNKKIAMRMEQLLEEIAEKGLLNPRYHTLLDALRPSSQGKAGQVSLPELLKAKNEGRLPDLMETLQDPTLSEAVSDYVKTSGDDSYYSQKGFEMLLAMAPEKTRGRKTRLTYLRNPKNVLALCTKAQREGGEDGKPLKRNSVRRYLYTATSKLLRFHLGNAERNNIFADVNFPKEDDAREVYLNKKELRKFLSSCYEIDQEIQANGHAKSPCVGFYELIRTAVSTGGDKTPLLRMQAKDVRIARDLGGKLKGVVYLDDRKTDSRSRAVAITDALCKLLLPLVESAEPEEKVFQVSRAQLQYRFEKARERAGMEHVRFKDLRHQFGTHAHEANVPLSRIQGAMGHGQRETTLIYTNRDAKLSLEDAEKIERQMGLSGPEIGQNRDAG